MSWTKTLRNVLSPGPGGDREFADSGHGFQGFPATRQIEATREIEAAQTDEDHMFTPDNRPAFDAIGQRDEVLRQRIGVMADRLDDLKSLQGDFAEMMGPLVRISDDLSRSSVRIAELEALLTQERQASSTFRVEGAALALRLTSAGNELAEANARAEQAEGALDQAAATIGELRIGWRDKTSAVETLERQLFAETEQSKALIGENKALRAEAQAVDSALARAEHDLLGARERLAVLDQDNRRLQLLGEEQAGQLADLGGRYTELEAAADQDRQRIVELEAQLATAIAARERSEAQLEADTGAHRTDRAGLMVKLESAESRAGSTEQMLTQARNQLREKDEAFRVAERNFKEASIARTTSNRRLESVQADLARQTERVVEMQRLRAELDDRCDMLTKALAAKDAALEQAGARNAALADRLDQVSIGHDAVRSELETANRRLMDDLQNERSERAILQGALGIARESRVALQKQHEALKRSGRGWREPAQDHGEDGPRDAEVRSEPEAERESNVRAFSSMGKPASQSD